MSGRGEAPAGPGMPWPALLLALALAALAGGPAPEAGAQLSGPGRPAAPSGGEGLDARVDRAVALRRELGLRSGRSHVMRLEADGLHGGAAATDDLGIALAPAESARLARRERATAALQSTVRAYVRQADRRESFAGLYVDQRAGGVVRAGFTEGARSRLRALRRRASHPGMVGTFRAEHSLVALRRFERRIAGDLPALRSLGVQTVGADVSRNAVRIVAAHPGPALRAHLSARYPGAPVELRAGSPPTLAANYDRFGVPPMVGAIEIYRRVRGGRIVCSAGFVARLRGSALPGIISAGHCGSRGQTFLHRRTRRGPYRVGEVRRDVYRQLSTADAMFVGRPRSKGIASIYTPGRQPNRPNPNRQLRGIRSVQPSGGVTEGELVCRSGGGSDASLGQGVFCGRVLATRVAALVFPGPVLLRRQVVADVITCAGDSGGPVYRRHQAKGVASAVADPLPESPECGETLLYGQIGRVEARLRADVVTRRP